MEQTPKSSTYCFFCTRCPKEVRRSHLEEVERYGTATTVPASNPPERKAA